MRSANREPAAAAERAESGTGYRRHIDITARYRVVLLELAEIIDQHRGEPDPSPHT